MVVPFATVTSNLVRLGIQLLLFVFVYLYFAFFTEATVTPNLYICLVPLLILLLSGLALGFGVLFSSLTTNKPLPKYHYQANLKYQYSLKKSNIIPKEFNYTRLNKNKAPKRSKENPETPNGSANGDTDLER